MYINVLNATDDGKLEVELDEEATTMLIQVAINNILKEHIENHERNPRKYKL